MYESVREQLPDERINRNIVECKDKHSSRKNKSPYRINRNIVECKGIKLRGAIYGITVLIETSWNVKEIIMICRKMQRSVLIETSWNVKFHSYPCNVTALLY